MSSANSGARAGFTLIEVLVAMVIGGLLVGVVFQLLSGQWRFTEVQNARQEVGQNARSTLELLSSELRGVDAAGLTQIGANEIRFRSPRVWGVLCGVVAGTNDLVALFPGGVDLRLADTNDSIAVHFPAAPRWRVDPADAVLGGAAERTVCATGLGLTAAELNPTVSPPQIVRVRGAPVIAGGAPMAGSDVYLFESAAYGVRTSNGRPWVMRSFGGATSWQPVAGPLADPTSLRFEYRDAAGAVTVIAGSVRRVDVVVAMRSTTSGALMQSDVVNTSVYLRNDGSVPALTPVFPL